MAEHITAHPPGLFGHIGGVEVALLTITRAGTFGAPVDYVTARRADVPAGTPEVSVDHAGPAELIRVPISVVDQLARWWAQRRRVPGESDARWKGAHRHHRQSFRLGRRMGRERP